MEFRQLECFKAVCEHLHFTRAAEQLGISQPTLSYQIKLLEEEVGIPLFNRIGKKITMTASGDILFKYCLQIFGALSGFRNEINELRQIERGQLSIAVLIGEINEFVSGVLGDFSRNHPNLKIRLIGSEDVVAPIISEDADIGVTILLKDDDRFGKIPIYEENFYFVMRDDHPLSGNTSVDFDQIRNEDIIMFPMTYRCRQMLDAVSFGLGFKLQPKIETTTIGSLLKLIQSGAGVTILSRTLLHLYERQGLVAIPVVNPSLTREIGIVYLKEKYLETAVRELIELIIQSARSLKLVNRK
ncbi:LysR family transcriptional regulator [Paenibacillus lignilyticus]|uniref:LysR family transcriptional regulator n=1 Tax=Paenibacillus lignilyticus TaxID=1172615 RepID=A0ABS5CNA1_9BACL|nr:LysR family transcriptional regulator [Paenibacillus lignilyticus]MBP3967340.1 LysR family transcriptional regulator [Paenibacillus lignilyticus]